MQQLGYYTHERLFVSESSAFAILRLPIAAHHAAALTSGLQAISAEPVNKACQNGFWDFTLHHNIPNSFHQSILLQF